MATSENKKKEEDEAIRQTLEDLGLEEPREPQFYEPDKPKYVDPGLNVPGVKYPTSEEITKHDATDQVQRDLEALGFPVEDKPIDPNYKPFNPEGEVLQQTVDEEGNKESFINIPNSPRDDVISETFEGAGRMVGGAVTKAAQSILVLSESLMENVGLNDPTFNWMKENFPTVAAKGNVEGATQDIMSMLTGGSAAVKIFETTKIASKLSSGITLFLSNFWGKAKKADPENAYKKTELMVRGFLTILAESGGASLTTPQNMESLSQMINEATGGEGDLGVAGHFLDNVGGNVLLRGAGKGIGKFVTFAKEMFPAFFGSTANANKGAIQLLRTLDTVITPKIPDKDVLGRAAILGDILAKNSDMEFSLLGVTKKFTQNTLLTVRKGAREYFERAYANLEDGMTPQEWTEWVDKQAIGMIDNMLGIKKIRLTSPLVQGSEAQVGNEAFDLMTDAVKIRGNSTVTNQVADDLTRPLINELTKTKGSLDKNTARMAKSNSDYLTLTENNEVMKLVDDAQARGQLNHDSTWGEDIKGITGDRLLKAHTVDRAVITQAVENIPKETTVSLEDAMSVAEQIKQLSDEQFNSFLDALKIIPSDTKSLGRVGQDTPRIQLRDDAGKFAGIIPATSPVGDIAEAVSGMSYYRLHKEILPALTRRIDDYSDEFGNIKPAGKTLVRLKEILLDLGDDQVVGNYRELYKKYAEKWLSNKALRDYDLVARNVRDVGSTVKPKGYDDAMEEGQNLIKKTRSYESTEYIQDTIRVLKELGPGAKKELEIALMGDALRALGQTRQVGDVVSSEQIEGAIKFNLRLLKETEPALAAKFTSTMDMLRSAEGDVKRMGQALDQIKALRVEVLNRATSDAAARLIFDIEGDAEIVGNPFMAFREILSSPNAPNVVNRLIDRAISENNQLAVMGLQGNLLKYIRDSAVVRSKTIALREGGQEFALGSSVSGAAKSLDEAVSNVVPLLKKVFKQTPKEVDNVVGILETIVNAERLNSLQPSIAGSNTIYNFLKNQAISQTARAAVKIVWGPLTRIGTTINTIASKFGGQSDFLNTKVAEMILDRMIVEPKYLSEILDAVSSNQQDIIERMVSELTIPLTKASIKVGADRVYDNNQRPEDEQTDEVLNEGNKDI